MYTNHLAGERRIQILEKQLSECKEETEQLQQMCGDRAMQVVNLQQQVIDTNNMLIKQQQQISDHNLVTNERFTSLNNQLSEFINANTLQWSDVVAKGSKMHRQLEDSMVSVMAQPILQKPASQQRTVSHVTSPTTQAEKERPTQTSTTGVSPATVQCKDKLTFKGASNSLSIGPLVI